VGDAPEKSIARGSKCKMIVIYATDCLAEPRAPTVEERVRKGTCIAAAWQLGVTLAFTAACFSTSLAPILAFSFVTSRKFNI